MPGVQRSAHRLVDYDQEANLQSPLTIGVTWSLWLEMSEPLEREREPTDGRRLHLEHDFYVGESFFGRLVAIS
jgi:hypothetical protein